MKGGGDPVSSRRTVMAVISIAITEEGREVAAASISEEGFPGIEISADHGRDLREGAFFELHWSYPLRTAPQRRIFLVCSVGKGTNNRNDTVHPRCDRRPRVAGSLRRRPHETRNHMGRRTAAASLVHAFNRSCPKPRKISFERCELAHTCRIELWFTLPMYPGSANRSNQGKRRKLWRVKLRDWRIYVTSGPGS